jgi:hypothetical protein
MPIMATISETLKQKIDELELDRRLSEATVAGEKALKQALAKAGEYAHDNREKAEALLDKAAAAIDEKTDGKYAQKLGRVKDQVRAGIDKLADQRDPSSADPAPVDPEGASEQPTAQNSEPKATPKASPAEPKQPETPNAGTSKFDWDAATDDG